MINQRSKRTISVLLSILMVLSCIPFSALPAFAAGAGEEAGLVLNKNYDASTGALMLESYVTGEKVTTTVSTSKPFDFVLVLDLSSSMRDKIGSIFSSGPRKIEALVTAAKGFVDRVNAQSPNSRIGIATFGDDGHQKLQMTAVSNAPSIKACIDVLGDEMEDNTNPQGGIQQGIEIYKKGGETNDLVMIVFTDGQPNLSTKPAGFDGYPYAPKWASNEGGSYSSGSDFFNNIDDALNAILEAQNAKDLGAKVYTIGMFDSASSEIDTFMERMSSEWNLKKVEKTGSGCDETLAKMEEEHKGGEYYFEVDSADNLNTVFTSITEEVTSGGASIELNSETRLHDVITDSFTLDTGAGKGIKVYKVRCTGVSGNTRTWSDTWEPINVSVDYDEATQTVDVSGFDYSENWCGLDENDAPHGYKLVVSIPIKPVAGTAGNNISTNTTGSGIIPPGETQVLPGNGFPVPETDLPATVNVKVVKGDGADETSYSFTATYDEVTGYTEAQTLEGGVYNKAVVDEDKKTTVELTLDPDATEKTQVFNGVHCDSEFVLSDIEIPTGYNMVVKVNGVEVDSTAPITINGNTEITIEYSRSSYFVQFVDTKTNPDSELKKLLVLNMDKVLAAEVPADPEAPAGYEFTGWTVDEDSTSTVNPADYVIDEATAFYTLYTPIENGSKYTVNVYEQNVDGSYPDIGTPTKSEKIVATAGASVQIDPETYISDAAKFILDEDYPVVTEGTVKGDGSLSFDIHLKLRTYTVTWLGADDKPIETDSNVLYGTDPSYDSDTPTKASTNDTVFKFKGWDKPIAPVTGDVTYKATFDSDTRYYTVTFKNHDDTVLYSNEYEYMELPAYPDEQAYQDLLVGPADEVDKVYKFDDWNNPIIPVTEDDVVYVATYKPEPRKYPVRWLKEDGTTEIKVTEVAYGDIPAYPEDASSRELLEKKDTAEFDYEFMGWTTVGGTEVLPKPLPVVQGETEFKAVYSATKQKHTVKWEVNGAIVETDEGENAVEYGEKPSYDGAEPTKASSNEYNYTFAGWSTDGTTPISKNSAKLPDIKEEVTFIAVFEASTRYYHVKFLDEKGEIFAEGSEFVYGQTLNEFISAAIAENDVPTKESTAKYEYTFETWNDGTDEDGLKAVTKDATYTPVFTESIRSYEVRWLDWNGEPFDVSVKFWLYDTMPEHGLTAEQLVRPANAEWTYTFTGWDPELHKVDGKIDYTAQYTADHNYYDITFVDHDGTSKSVNVEYSKKPNVDDPERASDGSYDYTFTGWTDGTNVYKTDTELPDVTGEATYTATYSRTPINYNIIYHLGDGETNHEHNPKTYNCETIGTVFNDAEKTGYTFDGWYTDAGRTNGITQITAGMKGELNLYPKFTINVYEVTFKDWDGTVLQVNGADTQSVEYNKPATAPADPTRENATFDGWDKTFANITEDTVVIAKYKYVPVTDGEPGDPEDVAADEVILTFVDEDGTTVLERKTIKKGEIAGTDYEPKKAQSDEFTYEFDGWNPETGKAVETDTVFKAQYKGTVRSYDVTFLDWDGTVLQVNGADTQSIEYNKAATAPANPTRENAEFDGWDKTFDHITKDTVVTAKYKYVPVTDGEPGDPVDVPEGYVILTFQNDDGSVLERKAAAKGTVAEYTGTIEPTKARTQEFTYTFDGWTPALGTVNKDTVYTAKYGSTTNKYTVTFKDWDGTVLQSSDVPYGEGAEAPADPTRENATFKGWDADFSEITDVLEVTALYEYTPVKDGEPDDPEVVPAGSVILTFKNDNGKVLERKAVAKGSEATYTSAKPTKAATAQYTYTFDKWTPALGIVNEDTVYTAEYNATVNKYTVTFFAWDGSEIVKHEDVPYGTDTITAPAAPSRAYCEFTGWDTDAYTFVKGNVDVHATYKTVPSKDDPDGEPVPYQYYTVTFLDWDGTILAIDVVAPGSDATAPADPSRKYCEFIGWNGDFTNVNADVVVTAKYKTFDGEEVPEGQFVVGFEDWNGTVLKVDVVAPHEDAEAPVHPDRAPDQYNHYINNNEWSQDFTDVTKDLGVVALYDAEPHYDENDDDYCDECGWELHKYRNVTYIPRHYLVIELIEGVIVDDYYDGCPAPRKRTPAAGTSIDSKTTYCQTTADRISFRVIETEDFTFHDKKIVVDNQEIYPDENGVYTVDAGIEDITIKAFGTIERIDPGEKLTCWERFYRNLRSFFQYICSLFKFGSNSASDSARDSAGSMSSDVKASADGTSGNK